MFLAYCNVRKLLTSSRAVWMLCARALAPTSARPASAGWAISADSLTTERRDRAASSLRHTVRFRSPASGLTPAPIPATLYAMVRNRPVWARAALDGWHLQYLGL